MKSAPASPVTRKKIHKLAVGQGHILHIEESGNMAGIPVIALHGGPGLSISSDNHRRFPPHIFRIIAFDQRGCGKSKSEHGPLHANTTAHQIADIEKIRTHLKIEKWVAAGASWGSTLALAYAQAYPRHVLGLIINSIYLGSKEETEWLTQPHGLASFFPQEYATILKLTGATPATVATKSVKIMSGPDKTLARKVSFAWAVFESLGCTPAPNRAGIADYLKKERGLLTSSLIEIHYLANNCFLKPHQLLKNAAKLKNIPVYILHGWVDLVCPAGSAQKLHTALPHSKLILLPSCGHYGHPSMEKARPRAARQLAAYLKKSR